MANSLNVAVVEDRCVACGCCLKVCPKNAINIYKGIRAVVEENLCVGCGKCSKICPANVISIVKREVHI